MALDGLRQRQGKQVMHVARAGPQTPKCRGAQLVGGILRARLDDTVAGLDVMQQEVAVGVNDLVPQRPGDGESAAVDHRARRCRRNGRDVTRRAAGFLEQSLAGARLGCRLQHRIARRHFGAADELRKVIDVSQAKAVGLVLRIGGDLADHRRVLRPQAVRDAHLVQVSIPDEREQAAVLIFPAKAADARLARRLEDRHLDGFTSNPARAGQRLSSGYGAKGGVVDRLHEAISQSVECCP